MIVQRSLAPAGGVDEGASLVFPPAASGPTSAMVYVASLQAAKSRKTAVWALGAAAQLLSAPGQATPEAWASAAWDSLSVDSFLLLRTLLAERMEPTSANLVLSMVRGVLRTALLRDAYPADRWAKILLIKGVRGEREPPGRALSEEELKKLAGAVPATGRGALVGAVLAVLAGAGLRRDEVGKQGLERWQPEALGGSLLVLGKGNKERRVPLPAPVQTRLRAWLAVRELAPGPLFPPCDEQGRWLPGRVLSGQAVARLLASLAQKAGVAPFGAHDLRRTYATLLFERDIDPGRVKRLMGHAKVETTLRYDRRGDRGLAEAAAALGLPW